MPSKKRKPTSHLLSRKPNLPKPTARGATIPSKFSRQLIRSHHTLQKRLAQTTDEDKRAKIQQKIDDAGGLERYQRASVSGQDEKRGGDSSKVLVGWLEEEEGLKTKKLNQTQDSTAHTVAEEDEGNKTRLKKKRKQSHADADAEPETIKQYSILEIGCLSPTNLSSTCGIFTNGTLIDLNSLHPSILKQDFMTFPISPIYDAVSLSLVLNYVPTPAGRGEMLRRTIEFFGPHHDSSSGIFPCLFLVLPSPCVTNSRYLTEALLEEMMAKMGYEQIRRKMAKKVVYYLWRWKGREAMSEHKFRKEEVNTGGGRNNFAVVFE